MVIKQKGFDWGRNVVLYEHSNLNAQRIFLDFLDKIGHAINLRLQLFHKHVFHKFLKLSGVQLQF